MYDEGYTRYASCALNLIFTFLYISTILPYFKDQSVLHPKYLTTRTCCRTSTWTNACL